MKKSHNIVTVVEGCGEVEAVPILVRNILKSNNIYNVKIARPWRVQKNKFLRESDFVRTLKSVYYTRGPCDCIIVILDADDDCPKEEQKKLSAWAENLPCPVYVNFAVCEFESWFLAGKDSLRGKYGITEEAAPPADPESIRDAKGEITKNMAHGYSYKESLHQPKLTAALDWQKAAERAPSLKRFARLLLTIIQNQQPEKF